MPNPGQEAATIPRDTAGPGITAPTSTEAAVNWADYVLRGSDDSVKTDLELVHTVCGCRLCDAEHDDTLLVLMAVAAGHDAECTGAQPDE
jgi:hypothetical protein